MSEKVKDSLSPENVLKFAKTAKYGLRYWEQKLTQARNDPQYGMNHSDFKGSGGYQAFGVYAAIQQKYAGSDVRGKHQALYELIVNTWRAAENANPCAEVVIIEAAKEEIRKVIDRDDIISKEFYYARYNDIYKKETQMTIKSIKFTTINYITLNDGSPKDITKLTADEGFGLIEQIQQEVARLNAIEKKPKALKSRIAELNAGIDRIVAELDSRE
jgi:hypothetical protein